MLFIINIYAKFCRSGKLWVIVTLEYWEPASNHSDNITNQYNITNKKFTNSEEYFSGTHILVVISKIW